MSYAGSLLFELCLEFGVKKVVYSSSASVYGTPTLIPTPENYPFDDCKLLYGTSKIALEYIAKSFMESWIKYCRPSLFQCLWSKTKYV